MGEVGEGEVVGQQVWVGRHWRLPGMAGRQFGDGLRRCRSDVVDVQFCLGQSRNEFRDFDVSLQYCPFPRREYLPYGNR